MPSIQFIVLSIAVARKQHLNSNSMVRKRALCWTLTFTVPIGNILSEPVATAELSPTHWRPRHTPPLLKAPRLIWLTVYKTHKSMRVSAKQKYLIKSVMVHNSQSKRPTVTLSSLHLKTFALTQMACESIG